MKKDLGQVFTDKWIVDIILDFVDYKNKDILSKHILEPSFGDGAFLVEIVKRYINYAISEKWTNSQIKKGLETYIHGIEIDEKYYKECLVNLNELIKKYNIESVQWDLYNTDSLKVKQFLGKMDYVVGNPPYVRVHNLEQDTRDYLKENFKMCSNGMIDLYIGFYELGLNMLKEQGILGFVTPNSFMYNTSCSIFREYIREENLLSKLINFGSEKIFNASTYNAIVVLDKNHQKSIFEYYTYKNNKVDFVDNLDLNNFKESLWCFDSNANIEFVEEVTNGEDLIGKIANVQYALATLRDKIYISENIKELDDKNLLFNGHAIEKDLLRPIIKGSTYDGLEIKAKIIFPYKKDKENKWIVIEEEEMKVKYPNAYNYFVIHKEELLKRDIDSGYLAWYQFGRSQGLQNIDKCKLSVKTIIKIDSKIVKTYTIPDNVFVYSGIFITGDNLELIKETIESEKFYRYAIITGKDLRGGYKTISSKIIKRFCIG